MDPWTNSVDKECHSEASVQHLHKESERGTQGKSGCSVIEVRVAISSAVGSLFEAPDTDKKWPSHRSVRTDNAK